MPTPARLAIASSVASAPSLVNASSAVSIRRSRLRWASARSGRDTVPPYGCDAALDAKRRVLRLMSNVTEEPPLQCTTGEQGMSEHITTPFGAESTAAQVVAGIDLTGKRAVVTGG